MAVAENARAGNIRDKKLQQTLYQQVAISFIKALEETDDMKKVLASSTVPEIGNNI